MKNLITKALQAAATIFGSVGCLIVALLLGLGYFNVPAGERIPAFAAFALTLVLTLVGFWGIAYFIEQLDELRDLIQDRNLEAHK